MNSLLSHCCKFLRIECIAKTFLRTLHAGAVRRRNHFNLNFNIFNNGNNIFWGGGGGMPGVGWEGVAVGQGMKGDG